MSLLTPSHSRNASTSTTFVPDELITEMLPYLTVKALIRFRCVCKSWNSFISDPTFVKLHLHRSSQKANFTLVSFNGSVVSFTSLRMFENPPIVSTLPTYQLRDEELVGSCNGLLCLVGRSYVDGNTEMWFRFWNPATRIISQRLGLLHNNNVVFSFHFTFGYCKSTNTYKVVALTRTNVRVFTLQDNTWRDIPNCYVTCSSSAVYMSGSVFWLEITNIYVTDYEYDYKIITPKQIAIISIDLDSEILYGHHPPEDFNEVPFVAPNLSVLEDCLCLSHDSKRTHFVIWQMKECGVDDCWTQFLKISYHNLQLQLNYRFSVEDFRLLPLCLSEKNDTVLLTNVVTRRAILYNRRDKRVENFSIPWWCENYVESLVSC
ncbi:unnamed protein product [Lathyrus oleraceus]|uniref:F-box/kelch-repeat protein At3g23880 n=1 Tax=Pisum sativum TaxID=3888 RepID=UPI0021CE3AA0|nr:F-box/kelch-repeat protein At3g23880-like [Pisum sativum]